MSGELLALISTAALLGTVHTVVGPDHYLPFAFLARAGRWSRTKTMVVTLACGVGHVAGSVVLASVGIVLGLALSSLELVGALRGQVAAWLLVGFGVAYLAWGLRRARTHSHAQPGAARRLAPWALFIVFVLGPCEVLIPLLIYAAAMHGLAGAFLAVAAFGLATLASMLVTVWICLQGLGRLPLGRLERYAHAMAGGGLVLCGAAVLFLGL
ncbi:MAG: sulfite exporter TauE/SafE family protein [Planctomycetota bacterium]